MANRAAEIRAAVLAQYPSAVVIDRGRGYMRLIDPIAGRGITETVAGASLHYHDGTAWQDIETNWADSDDPNFTDKLDRSHFRVYARSDATRRIFPRRAVTTEYVEIGLMEYWRTTGGGSWRSLPAGTKNRSLDKLTFDGTNIAISYTSEPDRLKLDIILKSSAAPTRARWPITLVGLNLDASWNLVSTATGEVVGRMPPPIMFDAAGTRRAVTVTYAGGYLEYNADVTGLVYPIDIDPTVDTAISAAADDAMQSDVNNFTEIDGYALWMRGNPSGGYYKYLGARMPLVGPSYGSAITAANISVYMPTATIALSVDAEASDNAAGYANTMDNLTSRTRTGNAVAWTVTGTNNAFNTSPSLVAPVQAVVNRLNWKSGNYVNFILTATSQTVACNVWMYEMSSAHAVRAHIEYAVNADPSTLMDTFSDGVMNSTIWELGDLDPLVSSADVTVAETNSQLQVSVGANDVNEKGNGYRTKDAINLSDRFVYVRVAQITNGLANTKLTVGPNADNNVRIVTEGGQIYFQYKVSGTRGTLASTTYSATAHAWWRVRHSYVDNTFYLETAPDANGVPGAWTTQGTWAAGFSATAVRVSLAAGSNGNVASAGTAIFDTANGVSGTPFRWYTKRMPMRVATPKSTDLNAGSLDRWITNQLPFPELTRSTAQPAPQDITLSIQDATHAHAADVVNLTTDGVSLTVQEALHSQAADTPAITQEQAVTVVDSVVVHHLDILSLTQTQDLVIEQSTCGQVADSPALTQGQVLVIERATSAQAVDVAALTQSQALQAADTFHVESADVPVLTQTQALSVAEAHSTHTADAAAVTSSQNLQAAAAQHSQAADSLSLTQAHLLQAQEAAHTHAADTLALTQRQVLQSTDGVHAQAADAPSLTQTHVLQIQRAVHASSADSPAVLSDGALYFADALHAHAAETPALTQAQNLVIADAQHTHTSETPSLGSVVDLVIARANHAQQADSVVLRQDQVLQVAPITHAASVDTMQLRQDQQLTIADTTTQHQALAPWLVQLHQLVIRDAISDHTAGLVALDLNVFLQITRAVSAHHASPVRLWREQDLVILDTLHGHRVDNLIFFRQRRGAFVPTFRGAF